MKRPSAVRLKESKHMAKGSQAAARGTSFPTRFSAGGM
jgi:hypothetical protein